MVPRWNSLQVSFMPRQVLPAFVHKPTGNPLLAQALCIDDIDAMCKKLGATFVLTCNTRKRHVQHYGVQGMEPIPKRVGNHTL